jgi:hypothetical protein
MRSWCGAGETMSGPPDTEKPKSENRASSGRLIDGLA